MLIGGKRERTNFRGLKLVISLDDTKCLKAKEKEFPELNG